MMRIGFAFGIAVFFLFPAIGRTAQIDSTTKPKPPGWEPFDPTETGYVTLVSSDGSYQGLYDPKTNCWVKGQGTELTSEIPPFPTPRPRPQAPEQESKPSQGDGTATGEKQTATAQQSTIVPANVNYLPLFTSKSSALYDLKKINLSASLGTIPANEGYLAFGVLLNNGRVTDEKLEKVILDMVSQLIAGQDVPELALNGNYDLVYKGSPRADGPSPALSDVISVRFYLYRYDGKKITPVKIASDDQQQIDRTYRWDLYQILVVNRKPASSK